MDAPYRKPWLGDRWTETGLLVLGESHYSNEDPEDPEMTRTVVSDVVEGRRRLRFFTAVERAVTDARPGRPSRLLSGPPLPSRTSVRVPSPTAT